MVFLSFLCMCVYLQSQNMCVYVLSFVVVVVHAGKHKERAANTSFYLDSVVAEVPPQRALRHNFQMFAGPKDPELLAQHELGDAVYYGWFAWFANLLE